MWLKSVVLENIKSFRERTEIYFSPEANFFVGPNGGGKSNLLEIINHVIRRYFILPYQVNQTIQAGTVVKDIVNVSNTRRLEKYRGQERRKSHIGMSLIVHEFDIQNMEKIKQHKADLEMALNNFYRNKPVSDLRFVDDWDPDRFREETELSFSLGDEEIFHNATLKKGELSDCQRMFHEYLSHLEMFLILATDVPEIGIKPIFFYMTSYRSATEERVRVQISQENYYQLLVNTFSATAHTSISPLKLGTFRLAAKHRQYESAAKEHGWAELWDKDSEVQIVDEQLKRVGYGWEIKSIDSARNIYELFLKDEGSEIPITQASSGEIELASVVLGVLGYNLYGGILLIDEPELHLHPRWQRLMRDTLVKLAEDQHVQIIAATHSPIFITPETLPHVHRIAKDKTGTTRVYSFNKNVAGDTVTLKDLLHIIQSHKNEKMFFADRVILVEGISDRLIFEAFVRHLSRDSTEVVEVLDVGGKDFFEKYKAILDKLQIPTAIIADRDYTLDCIKKFAPGALNDLVETDYRRIDNNVLKNKNSRDRLHLSQKIEQAIQECNCEDLRQLWERIKNRHTALRKEEELTEEKKKWLNDFLKELKEEHSIFILRKGEIEDYLPEGYREMGKIIDLTKDEKFQAWLKSDDGKVKKLYELIEDIFMLWNQ